MYKNSLKYLILLLIIIPTSLVASSDTETREASSDMQEHFFDNKDYTVTDRSTMLMWQQIRRSDSPDKDYRLGQDNKERRGTWTYCCENLEKSGHQKSWETAKQYCQDVTLAGKDDWRLPQLEELRSIIKFEKYNPAIDRKFFPDTFPSAHWTATEDKEDNDRAWIVHFTIGYSNHYSKNQTFYVRCVRNLNDTEIKELGI